MFKIPRKLRLNASRLNPKTVGFVVLFAILGYVFIVLPRAATPTTHFEPENAVLASGAVQGSDSAASNNKFVQFNANPTPVPPPNPPPGGVLPANTLPAVDGSNVGYLGDENSLNVASTTTPPSGMSYSSAGGYFESTSNTSRVYENIKFTRPVKFSDSLPASSGATITFRNCVFDVPGNQPYGGFTYQQVGSTKIVIEDCTFRSGALTGVWGNGHIQVDAQCTIRRNSISGRADGIQQGAGNCLIEQNYIHHPAIVGTYPNNTHNDGMQFYGGSGIQIRYNRIDLGWDGIHQNGALFFQGSFRGPVIDHNWLSGGGMTLRLENGVSGAIVTNNIFKLPTTITTPPSATLSNPPWGPYTHGIQGNVASWSNNVLDGTGQSVGL